MDTPRIPPLGIPLIGRAAPAGFPSPADDYVEDHLSLDAQLIQNPAFTFFVRTRGESMVGAGIFDGDLLVVDKSLQAAPGHVVIAVVDGELAVKRLACKGGVWRLLPENPAFPPIVIREGQELEIWGVVVASIRRHI